MSQQFCLKWNNHTTNMLQVFDNLLSTEALVDVTLACEGFSLKAHKMVLSACSPFFQSLFLDNPCKHPIVIMKDMRYTDLKAIIDFMYRGEVNVSHDQLSALLKTAETLKVKGLAEVTGENRHTSGIVQQEITAPSAAGPPTAQRTDTPPLGGKRKRGRPRKRSHSDSNRSDDEGVATKIKERDSPEVEELSGDASMEAPSDNGLRVPNSSNSLSQVPSHSSNNVNSFSNSHLSIAQDSQVDDQVSGDENEFEVEPSKLLEQTLTTDNVPSNSQNSTGHVNLPSVSGLEISRRSMSSTDSVSQAVVPASDSLGSNLQGPDSPQDIKPQILSFDDPPISPVAGTSHGSERSMMMYMDQSGVASIPGPSNYQDNSALVPHDSQPQDYATLESMINGCRFTRHSENNSANIGKHHYKSHSEHNLNKSLKSKRKLINSKRFSLSQGKLLQSKLSSKSSEQLLSKISSKPKEKQLQHKLSVKPQKKMLKNVLQGKLPCVISSEPEEKISILKIPSEPRKKICSKMPAKQQFLRSKSEEKQLRQKPSVKQEEKLLHNESQRKFSLSVISPELEKKSNLIMPSEPKKRDNFKTLSKPKKKSVCSKSFSIPEGKFSRTKIVSKPEEKSPHDKISFLPNETFPCDYCEFEADSIRNLRQHGLIHSILYHMCGNSGKFYLKSDLFPHLEAVHPHIAYCYCDLCGREFTSVTAKMCHRRTCMQEELLTCKQCHKIFYDIIAFKQHERTHGN